MATALVRAVFMVMVPLSRAQTPSTANTRNGLLLRSPDVCEGDNTGVAFYDTFSGSCEWEEVDMVVVDG